MSSLENSCCFTGHRPKYFAFRTNETHPDCIVIKDFLQGTCDRLIAENGVTHFFSGGAVGVDTWAMEAVIALKETHRHVTLECVLPYAGMPDGFAPVDRERYARIKPMLDVVTVLNERRVPGCMQQRNEYMVDRAQYLIAVWTGRKSGTGNTVRYARQCGRNIIHLNPGV